MSFELEGKLIVKSDTQHVSDRFKKREFVIEKEEHKGDMVFTDTIKFQLTQDKCDLLEDYKVGEIIKVTFNVKGNKWEKAGKTSYFVNLDAWRLDKESVNQNTAKVVESQEPVLAEEGADDSDLPF